MRSFTPYTVDDNRVAYKTNKQGREKRLSGEREQVARTECSVPEATWSELRNKGIFRLEPEKLKRVMIQI